MQSKFSGFFNPATVTEPVHIIGCGAIGSTLALQLTRCGITNISIWDYDSVAQHNLANQQFLYRHIGEDKTVALQELMLAINPQQKITLKGMYIDQVLSGYVFMAVDHIATRQLIVDINRYNRTIKALFDFRMRLKDAQHYGVDWSQTNQVDNFIKTMGFTQEEADANNPVNACGMSMSIIPTIETVVAVGVSNFINFTHNKEHLKNFIMVNPFDY